MKILLRYIIVTIVVIASLSTNYAQNLAVSIDRQSILIGEQFSMQIEYQIAKATSSFDFQKGDSIGDGFEVFELISHDTVKGIARINLGISSFEPGNRFISSFSVFYDSVKVVSDSIPVFVSLVQIDTSKSIIDIHPIFEDPLTAEEKWQLFWEKFMKALPYLIGLLVLILVAIWFFFIRKKKVKVIKEEPIVVIPPHIIANKSLEELREKQLWQKGNQKEYNVELTEIIQNYITGRYKVATKEKTSSEILHSIRFVEMDEQNKNNLRQLLMLSDLVKFAKEKPTESENNQVLKNAFDFVDSTKSIID